MRRILVGTVMLCVALCAADEIRVPDDWPTIQEAIFAAKDGDVVIVADGVYTGSVNRNIDFGGLAITVRSENGPENCIIDCESKARAFKFRSGESSASVLRGFTITNGKAEIGGAIRCNNDASPTIIDCVFITNAASSGGAIWCEWGSGPTISGCVFLGNRATHPYSGVLHLGGNSLVTACAFTKNEGTSIYCDNGNPTIENCAIFDNSMSGGRGIRTGGGSPIIRNCIISGNHAMGGLNQGGGGIYLYGSASISDCLIVGNSAHGNGGGIYLNDSTGTISNCLIIGNSTLVDNTRGNGGGVYSTGRLAAPVFVGCTLARNSADYGGAFYFEGSKPTVSNCILWGNIAKRGGPELAVAFGAVLAVSYSDVAGGSENAFVGDGAELVWGDGNIIADPLFVDPDNGDFRIGVGSPCIDAADNTAVPEGTTLDLGGAPRFVDDPDTEDTGKGDPPIVDMGAYEFQGCTPCDANCDGSVDLADVEPFIGLLLSGDDPCSECAGDANADGSVDLTDVESFIGCLLG